MTPASRPSFLPHCSLNPEDTIGPAFPRYCGTLNSGGDDADYRLWRQEVMRTDHVELKSPVTSTNHVVPALPSLTGFAPRFTSFGAYECRQLNNGARLHLAHVPHSFGILTSAIVRAGSCDERAGEYGAAHLLEHCAALGEHGGRTEVDFEATLDAKGIRYDASTSFESTAYPLKGSLQHAELILDILSGALYHPPLDSESVELQKRIVTRELSETLHRDSGLQAARLSTPKILRSGGFERSVIGTATDVESLNREKLLSFHQRLYRPGNIDLLVAANITPSLERMLSEKLDIPTTQATSSTIGREATISTVWEDRSAKRSLFIERPSVSDPYVLVRFPGVTYSDPDGGAAEVLFNGVLGSSGRFITNLRSGRGLVYGIRIEEFRISRVATFDIGFSTSRDYVSTAVDALRESVDELLRAGFTDQELATTKDRLISTLPICDTGAMGWMGTSLRCFDKVVPTQDISDRISKVTNDDIKRVVRRIFSDAFFTMVGPQEPIELQW